jgi:PQQ system protein
MQCSWGGDAMPNRVGAALGVCIIGLALLGCEYAGLLRPSVLSELDPPTVRLLNELPEVDQPNEATIARLFATGGLAHAEPGPDGILRAAISVPEGQMIWKPAIVVMPYGGELELVFSNRDDALHMAFLPSNGGREVVELPPGQAGRARIRLDGPGLYWFGCPVANHVGRGMLGFVLVEGDAPPAARLDRPPQKQPTRG